MKRNRKPYAYMKQYYNGRFMFTPTKIWRAEDTFGNFVASGKTRKECEAECRRAGYKPIKDK